MLLVIDYLIVNSLWVFMVAGNQPSASSPSIPLGFEGFWAVSTFCNTTQEPLQ